MTPQIQAVRPPSKRNETRRVLAAAALIVSAALGEIAWSRSSGETARAPEGEVLFADLPFAEQRAFREIQEGLVEAERFRSDKGRWPIASDLAGEGVPPFARTPGDPSTRAWTSAEDYTGLNYLGWPTASGERALLVLIQEAGEWAEPGATGLDEEHHQLAEGDLIHVSVWVSEAKGDPPQAVIAEPKLRGWTRIRIAPPALIQEPKR